MPKITLKIDGMMCECCVAKVEDALKAQGVENLSVKIGKATFTYDESKTNEDKLIEAVVNAGFTAKVKKGLF